MRICAYMHMCVGGGWGGVWGYVCVCMQAFVCMPALAHDMTFSGILGYWEKRKKGVKKQGDG